MLNNIENEVLEKSKLVKEVSHGSSNKKLSKMSFRNSHNRSVSEITDENSLVNFNITKKTKSKFNSLNKSITRYSARKKVMDKSNSAYFASEKTGPGAYNLPALLGSISMEANKRNFPAYSIGTQNKQKILILWKSQAEAFKGQSSPGVCKYEGNFLTLKWKSPNATIGRERRFSKESERK